MEFFKLVHQNPERTLTYKTFFNRDQAPVTRNQKRQMRLIGGLLALTLDIGPQIYVQIEVVSELNGWETSTIAAFVSRCLHGVHQS